ncbi:ATP-dependent RNA helicase DHX36-like [Microtus ochrogaster]|uniref:ATP-dependent RNA helicase DHX36-like n=1 Tax=Microtus ochrogaster TaxID=79684 RepID=A0ABM0KDI6_MICOH|nr:ATP-dependent RNA helicase DHX36-like [Microtus ochrogaster]
MCACFRARTPFSAVNFLLRLEWSSGTMSYDYHQSWSRDAGPRGSGPGSGGGGGGNRGPGGGGGGGGGGRGGRGRHPGHLKGREIGLWYARKQTQKNKEAERQERAVVHMDERREEQIVQLLNSVQAKNDKDSEAQISWFAPEDHGYGTEVSSEKKNNSEKKLDNQEKKSLNQEKKTFRITDKSYIDRDSEYLLQENEPNGGLDQQLLEDLQKKKSDPRYIEMQVMRSQSFFSLPWEKWAYGRRLVPGMVECDSSISHLPL